MPDVSPEVRAGRILLYATGATQQELAAFLGVSNFTLSRVLTGHRHNPDLVKAMWLALTSREFDQALAEARS